MAGISEDGVSSVAADDELSVSDGVSVLEEELL